MASKATFKHRIEYMATRAMGFLLNALPLRAALFAGALLGNAAWFLGVRKRVARLNISAAFPNKSRKEIDRIGRKSYASSGMFMVEFIRQPRMGRNYFEKYITVEPTPALQELLEHNGGVMSLSGHYGNWEYFGASHVFLGKETSFLVGKQRNPLVNRYMNSLRSSLGPSLLTRDVSMRGVIRISRSGGVVCWLSDQNAGRNGLVVDFFGMPASTPRGAGAFSVKLDMPIAIGAMIRRKGPFQTLSIRGFLVPDPGLSKHEAEVDITSRYTAVLEEMIREHPQMYWWAHRRWKGTTGIYSRNSPR